jgi:ABC-2 type transport system ATP-binding protein
MIPTDNVTDDLTDKPTAIQITGLVKRFGNVAAVDGLDLSVPSGVLFGFLGPNGAGKTTTLKMLTGLLRPTAGSAVVAGFDVVAQPLEVKRRIGVVPETLALYERLTANEFLELVGRIHGLDAARIERRRGDLLARLDLDERADTLTVDYSTGMRKKLALAAALLPAPQILFLDEPFEGVDAVSSRVIKDILRRLVDERGVTVFFSTHIMELVEKLCDEVAIIKAGRLVAEGSLSELRQQSESGGGASLEDVFLDLVDAEPTASGALDWLDE